MFMQSFAHIYTRNRFFNNELLLLLLNVHRMQNILGNSFLCVCLFSRWSSFWPPLIIYHRRRLSTASESQSTAWASSSSSWEAWLSRTCLSIARSWTMGLWCSAPLWKRRFISLTGSRCLTALSSTRTRSAWPRYGRARNYRLDEGG